jgi:hypothetical protein
MVYCPKRDFIDLAARNITLMEAVEDAEVVTSLGRKAAVEMKVREQ